MNPKTLFTSTVIVLTVTTMLSACKKKKDDDIVVVPKIAEAKIIPINKSKVTGLGTFTEVDGKVTLKLSVAHAAPGLHAVHIHDGGDCSVGDSSNVAGGHWNPTAENHGKWGTPPHHRGDIGNITIGSDSTGTLELTTDLWAVGGTDAGKNVVNHAVLVHQKEDNYSQPTGAAGYRLACGEIKQK